MFKAIEKINGRPSLFASLESHLQLYFKQIKNRTFVQKLPLIFFHCFTRYLEEDKRRRGRRRRREERDGRAKTTGGKEERTGPGKPGQGGSRSFPPFYVV
jgi:hypothetical protein